MIEPTTAASEHFIMHLLRPIKRCFFCCCLGLVGSMVTACGVESLIMTPSGLVAGLSLSDLRDIQNDERLTPDQQREQIRQAIGAPETAAGDRLVQFLLNFNVP